jgi:hypothetical protein
MRPSFLGGHSPSSDSPLSSRSQASILRESLMDIGRTEQWTVNRVENRKGTFFATGPYLL